MRLAIELAMIYGLYVGGLSLLVWRYEARERGSSIVVISVMPILAVIAVFWTLFLVLFKRTSLIIAPCPNGLAEAEEVVEKQRQKMFGGDPMKPHFATDWADLYAAALEQEAEHVHKFAGRILSIA